MAEGLWNLISNEETGLGKILKAVCNVLVVVKNGVCDFFETDWIATGLRISCNRGDKKCWWIPTSGGSGQGSLIGFSIKDSGRKLLGGGSGRRN